MPKRDCPTPGPNLGATAAELTIAQSAGRSARPLARAIAPIDDAGIGGADSALPDLAAQHPRLGPDLQAMIGQQLRAVYHEILNEPVPDRFVKLLEELATKEADRR
jgi:hypothetical protein